MSDWSVAELLHSKHPSGMTWAEAEALYPGCSARWDVTSQRFRSDWEVRDLYVNCWDGLTVLVWSPDPDCFWVGRPQRHAYFSYGPGDHFWLRC